MSSILKLSPNQRLWERYQKPPQPAAAPLAGQEAAPAALPRPRPGLPRPVAAPRAHRGRMSSWSLSSAGISASALRLAAIATRSSRRLPPPCRACAAPRDPERHRRPQRRDRDRPREPAGPGAPGEQRPHRSVPFRVIGRGRREEWGEKQRRDAVLPCSASRAAPCTRWGGDAPRKARELLRTRGCTRTAREPRVLSASEAAAERQRRLWNGRRAVRSRRHIPAGNRGSVCAGHRPAPHTAGCPPWLLLSPQGLKPSVCLAAEQRRPRDCDPSRHRTSKLRLVLFSVFSAV